MGESPNNEFIHVQIEIIIDLLRSGFRLEQIKAISKTVNERNLKSNYRARRKLAGISFSNFSAFFHKNWRENDILWGRLDGAERLVSIVLNSNTLANSSNQSNLPEKQLLKARSSIIDELHGAILQKSDLINNAQEKSKEIPKDAKSLLSKTKLIKYVRNKYNVERSLSPKATFKATSRSLKILRKIVSKENLGTLPRLTTTALLAALQGIIRICTPGGIAAGIFTLFYLTISAFSVLTLFFNDSSSSLMSVITMAGFILGSGFFFIATLLLFVAWGALKIFITNRLMKLVSDKQ
jgi:hypothetical protein